MEFIGLCTVSLKAPSTFLIIFSHTLHVMQFVPVIVDLLLFVIDVKHNLFTTLFLPLVLELYTASCLTHLFCQVFD